MFLGSSHEKSATDQDNRYILQYNPSQEASDRRWKRVYDFFLRVVKNADGKGVVGN